MTSLIDSLEVFAFRLLLGTSRRLGLERASALGATVLRLLGPRIQRHQKVLRNLEIAFPERNAAWHRQTAIAMWGEFGRGLAEYAHLPELSRPSSESRIEIVEHPKAAAAHRAGRPIVFVAAHLANWNLPAVIGAHLGFSLSVLYRRRKNPRLEALIERWRNQMPCGFIDVEHRASKLMIDELKNGRSIGLFIDRRGRDGELLPFFGVETPTPTIAARLALKTGADFIPVRIERLPHVRFRITLGEPISSDAADDRERARRMTETVNHLFEGWIREYPEQWLSTAKRWPAWPPSEGRIMVPNGA